ncbi:3-oxoacyl-[acyl-carrier-protein] synthase I, chloroplastic-like [Juglans regia]|uniref:beta-ketoacyl-[acyl-carrier-protein] synthase I n=1 Tax=Juglans regia TaxID=51240 RepID=A0A6P9F516_JUGRE|nr:3-oxoacyl-[acyl-carrier-protein] synthase I, chloroplastic-like [Juglans regia]
MAADGQDKNWSANRNRPRRHEIFQQWSGSSNPQWIEQNPAVFRSLVHHQHESALLGLVGACRALSHRNDEPQKASRPRDKDRDGFVMGEASGVLWDGSVKYKIFLSKLSGDIAEVNAIIDVFKGSPEIKRNWTKSLIGHCRHCLGAASGLEANAIATIKAITTGWLHPTIDQDNLEPDVTIDTAKREEKHVMLLSLSL